MDEYIRLNTATDILADKIHYESIRDRLIRERDNGNEFYVCFKKHGTDDELTLTTNPNVELGEVIMAKAFEIINRKIAEQERKFAEL